MIDTAPAVRMALLGAALALVPLLLVAWRQRGSGKLRRANDRGNAMHRPVDARAHWLAALTWTTLFLTFDLVLFGSFTRLTDSGLGCPDWPGCYGFATPLGAKEAIDAAASAQPDGPVTTGKAWIEMIHRYFATAVGALITAMTVLAWWSARRDRASLHASEPSRAASLAMSPWWPTLTLAWVVVQGAFGALTVTMRLYPAIVTVHLLLGMGLLALLAMQACKHRRLVRGSAPLQLDALATGERMEVGPLTVTAWAAATALVVQLALGGWVSTNYAVLACQDFPTCQGAWWPAMDFEQGFAIKRELGRAKGVAATNQAAFVPFAALTAIHVTHRAFALVVALLVGWLAWRTWQRGAQRASIALLGLLAWQVATGVSNVVLGWPVLAALAHVAGAAGLVTVLSMVLTICLSARERQASSPAPSDTVRKINPSEPRGVAR